MKSRAALRSCGRLLLGCPQNHRPRAEWFVQVFGADDRAVCRKVSASTSRALSARSFLARVQMALAGAAVAASCNSILFLSRRGQIVYPVAIENLPIGSPGIRSIF